MAKKTFKDDNPAMQFISKPQQAGETEEGVKVVYVEVAPETKSKRVQLLMQPSLHGKLKVLAEAKEQSLNDFIHEELKKLTEEA